MEVKCKVGRSRIGFYLHGFGLGQMKTQSVWTVDILPSSSFKQI